MNKKGLVVLILIAVFAVAGVVVTLVSGFGSSVDFEAQLEKEGETPEKAKKSSGGKVVKVEKSSNRTKKVFSSGKNYIAVLYVEGEIMPDTKTYSQKYLLDTIDDLMADKKNVGIMLYLDTPGGSLYEADELYLKLIEYKAKTERPIYSYMASMACSAGYYIACSSEKIIANRNSMTGAIGIIMSQVFDATELLDKMGVKSTTIYAGKNKNMMNFNEPFTKEQQAIMQELANEAYEQFVDVVIDGRNMSNEKAHRLADGRVYSSKQAVENGLIDEISDYKSAIDQFQRKISRDMSVTTGKHIPLPEIEQYRYEQKFSFSNIFGKVPSLKKTITRPFEMKSVVR